MAVVNLSQILSIFQSAGLTPAQISAGVQSLAASSPTTAVQTICTAILANSNNPKVVGDEVTKLAEVPNLPVAVANLLPTLGAATTPVEIVQAVQAIETAMGGNGIGLFHLL